MQTPTCKKHCVFSGTLPGFFVCMCVVLFVCLFCFLSTFSAQPQTQHIHHSPSCILKLSTAVPLHPVPAAEREHLCPLHQGAPGKSHLQVLSLACAN